MEKDKLTKKQAEALDEIFISKLSVSKLAKAPYIGYEVELYPEKESKWWEKHGREPWELKIGDVLHDEKEGYTGTVEKIIAFNTDDEVICFTDGKREYAKNVPEQFKVVCFVEDRKDVKVNEQIRRDKRKSNSRKSAF